MNRLFILLSIVFLSCETVTVSIEDKIRTDEQIFNTERLDPQFTKRVIDLWEEEYKSTDYEIYVRTLDILLRNGYVYTAEALAKKVKTKTVTPERLTGFYESLGVICMHTSKFDSAIYFFRHAYLAFPKVPQYVGHNQLHFYNDAVMTWIEAERCEESQIYFDSLITVTMKYPDSLFYIGGEQRLEEFRDHIQTICSQSVY